MNSLSFSSTTAKKPWSTPQIEALKTEDTLSGAGALNEQTCTAANYTDDSGAADMACPPPP